jgi:translocation and assembly module TamA
VKHACRLAAALLLLPLGAARGASLQVTIEGLQGELQDAASANLSLTDYTSRDVTAAQVRRLFERGKDEIRQALEPFGYYESRVDGRIEAADEAFRVNYRVEAGEPVIVRHRDIRVDGEGRDMREVREAVAAAKPDVGERLDHAAYERSKTEIASALVSVGYLAAEADRHRVEVLRAAREASIDLEFESGPRFRFGDVRFSKAQFSREFLERFIPWQPGEYYTNEELLELQQRVVDADYFSTVAVVPNVADAEGTNVPIDVLIAPAKRNVYAGSLYVTTDSGPGVRLSYTRRWLNGDGHKLRTELEYSSRLQVAGVRYAIPRPGRDNRSFNFGAAYRDEETASSTSQGARAAVNETREWRDWTRTLGLQYIGGDFEIGSTQSTTSLVYAEGIVTRRRADDLYFPRHGHSLDVSTRATPSDWLGDTSFAQLAADGKLIRPFGERGRLIGRTSLGMMGVEDFDALPPELRFFAGGDRSVRGFDYQALGTQNDAGEVIGGQYLVVLSAELEHYFMERWGAAAFVDAGDAFSSEDFEANVGAGIGLRWRSPIGTLRIDVAKPLESELADEFRLHITIGPDL